MEFLKKQGFLTKARLCLCLIFGSGLLGCSTLREGSKPVTELKIYHITANRLPGYEDVNLLALLDGVLIRDINGPAFSEGVKELPGQLNLSLGVNNEIVLHQVLSRLQSSGFRIGSSILEK